MENRWIKLHDTLLEWEWWDDPLMVKAWVFLLMRANWKEQKWMEQRIPKGSFVSSRKKLSNDLNCSERQVRTILHRLQASGEIEIKTTNKFTYITICNYDSYQQDKTSKRPTSDQQNDQQTTNKRPTNDQRKRMFKQFYYR